MKITLDGAKPKFETDEGAPFPAGVSGFTLHWTQGGGVEAVIALDLIKVRAMVRPRVCIQLGGELARVHSITLDDGRTLTAADLIDRV